jgi:hypothetical protein
MMVLSYRQTPFAVANHLPSTALNSNAKNRFYRNASYIAPKLVGWGEVRTPTLPSSSVLLGFASLTANLRG